MNLGNHSLFFAKEMQAKKVYAFEPQAYFCEIAAINMMLNDCQDKVEIHNIAISNENKQMKVKVPIDNPSGASIGYILPDNVATYESEFTLENWDFTRIADKVDLIKIDVEGHEWQVLDSKLLNLIKRDRPFLWIELWNYQDDFKAGKLDTLQALGYTKAKALNQYNILFFPSVSID